ncbi:hypothetical protein HWV62_16652 [Athelia sp. TMB]|nr:hypothetical protein HWV62_16652 [Athelia sp. TMB]
MPRDMPDSSLILGHNVRRSRKPPPAADNPVFAASRIHRQQETPDLDVGVQDTTSESFPAQESPPVAFTELLPVASEHSALVTTNPSPSPQPTGPVVLVSPLPQRIIGDRGGERGFLLMHDVQNPRSPGSSALGSPPPLTSTEEETLDYDEQVSLIPESIESTETIIKRVKAVLAAARAEDDNDYNPSSSDISSDEDEHNHNDVPATLLPPTPITAVGNGVVNPDDPRRAAAAAAERRQQQHLSSAMALEGHHPTRSSADQVSPVAQRITEPIPTTLHLSSQPLAQVVEAAPERERALQRAQRLAEAEAAEQRRILRRAELGVMEETNVEERRSSIAATVAGSGIRDVEMATVSANTGDPAASSTVHSVLDAALSDLHCQVKQYRAAGLGTAYTTIRDAMIMEAACTKLHFVIGHNKDVPITVNGTAILQADIITYFSFGLPRTFWNNRSTYALAIKARRHIQAIDRRSRQVHQSETLDIIDCMLKDSVLSSPTEPGAETTAATESMAAFNKRCKEAIGKK